MTDIKEKLDLITDTNKPLSEVMDDTVSDVVNSIFLDGNTITIIKQNKEQSNVEVDTSLPDISVSGELNNQNVNIIVPGTNASFSDSFEIPYFTTDEQGRITSINQRKITISRSSYSNYYNYYSYSQYSRYTKYYNYSNYTKYTQYSSYSNYQNYYNYGNYSDYSNYVKYTRYDN